jgi:hypothetical protein
MDRGTQIFRKVMIIVNILVLVSFFIAPVAIIILNYYQTGIWFNHGGFVEEYFSIMSKCPTYEKAIPYVMLGIDGIIMLIYRGMVYEIPER